MIYVAVTPVWGYAILVALSVCFLTLCWYKLERPRRLIISLLYCAVLMQVLSGAVPLYLTAQKSISKAACITGHFVGPMNLILIALSLILFLYVFVSSRHGFWTALKKHGYFMAAVALAQFLALAIYMRSALLCTV